MTDENKKQLLQGMFNGAQLTNVQVIGVVESGAKVVYKEVHGVQDEMAAVTDEQVARAIRAINGPDRVLSQQNLWVGVCCLLGWKYGFPRNLGACCERILSLPLGELAVACKYESIRKYGSWKFVAEDARQWEIYQARAEERSFFNDCLAVARALDAELQGQE